MWRRLWAIGDFAQEIGNSIVHIERSQVSTDNDKWLRAMLPSGAADRTAACLDAEQLAAWFDGTLTAQERAQAELHMSSCAHCMGALAALQRTAPTTTARRHDGTAPTGVFDRLRLFRWLVPITAAATAVAIWVVVPDRQPAVQELPSASRTVVPAPAPQEKAPQQPARESQSQSARDTYSPVPNVGNQALERPSSRADSAQLRDEARQREEIDTLAKAETADLSTPAKPTAEVPAAPPAAASPIAKAPPELGAAAREESTADAKLRRAAPMAFAQTVSISPSDASAGWRIAKAGAAIERSTDGGQTWMPIPRAPGVSPGPPAVTIRSIRAVDARRAVATTSDGRQFYTTDTGESWTLVQENQTAPF